MQKPVHSPGAEYRRVQVGDAIGSPEDHNTYPIRHGRIQQHQEVIDHGPPKVLMLRGRVAGRQGVKFINEEQGGG